MRAPPATAATLHEKGILATEHTETLWIRRDSEKTLKLKRLSGQLLKLTEALACPFAKTCSRVIARESPAAVE